jgi:hypothetical protein
MPKTRNIIIFVSIAVVFVLIYIFFIKSSSSSGSSLVSSPAGSALPDANTGVDSGAADANVASGTPFIAQDFLTLLLNVKNIKLDDSIFADPAFNSLHDSSITLTPDNTEGRPNPFAQFGSDAAPAAPPTCALPQVLNKTTNTCVTPSTPKP